MNSMNTASTEWTLNMWEPRSRPRARHHQQKRETNFEIIHELIMASVMESTDKATTIGNEEDTLLFRKKLQQKWGSIFFAAAIQKDKHIKPIVHFCTKERLGGASTHIWRLPVQRPKQAACQGRLSTTRR